MRPVYAYHFVGTGLSKFFSKTLVRFQPTPNYFFFWPSHSILFGFDIAFFGILYPRVFLASFRFAPSFCALAEERTSTRKLARLQKWSSSGRFGFGFGFDSEAISSSCGIFGGSKCCWQINHLKFNSKREIPSLAIQSISISSDIESNRHLDDLSNFCISAMVIPEVFLVSVVFGNDVPVAVRPCAN
jgi:hypothetical protein